MNGPRGLLYLSLFAVLLAAAQAPVAQVSSTEPFLLSGARVPVAGVSSWPLSAGDEVSTDAAAAVIAFRDGSRVTLNKQSKAKLESKGEGLILRLLNGTGTYTLAANSKLRLYEGQKPAGTALVPAARTEPAASPGSPRTEVTAPPPISRR